MGSGFSMCLTFRQGWLSMTCACIDRSASGSASGVPFRPQLAVPPDLFDKRHLSESIPRRQKGAMNRDVAILSHLSAPINPDMQHPRGFGFWDRNAILWRDFNGNGAADPRGQGKGNQRGNTGKHAENVVQAFAVRGGRKNDIWCMQARRCDAPATLLFFHGGATSRDTPL